jgi:hypothetical protein
MIRSSFVSLLLFILVSIMTSVTGSWMDLIKMMEPDIAPEDVQAIEKLMITDNQCLEPSGVKGLSVANAPKVLRQWEKLTIPLKAILGRCIRYINDEKPAKSRLRGPLLLRTYRWASEKDLVPYETILGAMASNEVVEAAMEYKDEVKVDDLLVKHGMNDVNVALIPDAHIWKLLLCQTKGNANAFTYVDFTCNELLPVHVSADSIGGSFGVPGDASHSPASADPHGYVETFGSAPKAAVSKPRFIRHMQQWQAIYTKYSVAAICCGQLTASQAMNHRDTISRLHAQCQAEGLNLLTAVLYDELVRREWHERALQKDATLDINNECKHVSPRTWSAAKSMIQDVLEACGILSDGQRGVQATQIYTVPPGELQLQAREARACLDRHILHKKTQEEIQQPHNQKETRMQYAAQHANEIKGALNRMADGSSKGNSKRRVKSRAYIDWVRSVKKDNKGKGHSGHQPSTSSWT